MSKFDIFWMIYGLRQGAPTVRHKTEESAIAEAKRLAKLHPDIEFFVLEATHHVVKRDVDVTPIGHTPWHLRNYPDDDIPF